MDRMYVVKKLTPSPIRKLMRYLRDKNTHREFRSLTLSEKFNKIYCENWWANYRKDKSLDFDSGFTSYVDYILEEYISVLQSFLEENSNIKTIMDLGCGDFNVGSKIAPLFDGYIGVDIVEGLVIRNQKKFSSKSISFLYKDITTDELPSADLICVRQVLQHLSNQDIQSFLDNIKGKYKYLIITETMHRSWRFMPNRDISSGPGTRFHKKSGVVLDAPPFNLKYEKKILLCEPRFKKEFLPTILYKLK